MDFQDFGAKMNGSCQESSVRSNNKINLKKKKAFPCKINKSYWSYIHTYITGAQYQVQFSSSQAAGFLSHRALLPQFLQGSALYSQAGAE